MEVKTFSVSNKSIINKCYLVQNHNAGILIDPAWDYAMIDAFLKDNRIFIEAILLTHGHGDHTDLADQFAKLHNVPVYMSETEIKISGFTCANLEAFSDWQPLETANFEINTIPTPGHTLGSVCYEIEGNLFTGDTIFIEGVGICSRENAERLFDSVIYLKQNVSQDTIIWPGHKFGDDVGKPFGHVLRNNIYFQFDKVSHFVDFRMRKSRPDPFQFKE